MPRTADQIISDRLRPGERTRTGAQIPEIFSRNELAGGSVAPPADYFVSWVGSTPTVTLVFRFGNVGGRGFSEGGLA